jgi:hypothetical protein
MIRSTDPRGIELDVLVAKDGSITAHTPESNFPPNNLVVGALPDGLVPDTATERVVELRGKRLTPQQLVSGCALAIHGWLLAEWATFGPERLQGCLSRLLRTPVAKPAEPLPRIQAGALDPEFGSKLVAQVMLYLEQWQVANR